MKRVMIQFNILSRDLLSCQSAAVWLQLAAVSELPLSVCVVDNENPNSHPVSPPSIIICFSL